MASGDRPYSPETGYGAGQKIDDYNRDFQEHPDGSTESHKLSDNEINHQPEEMYCNIPRNFAEQRQFHKHNQSRLSDEEDENFSGQPRELDRAQAPRKPGPTMSVPDLGDGRVFDTKSTLNHH